MEGRTCRRCYDTNAARVSRQRSLSLNPEETLQFKLLLERLKGFAPESVRALGLEFLRDHLKLPSLLVDREVAIDPDLGPDIRICRQLGRVTGKHHSTDLSAIVLQGEVAVTWARPCPAPDLSTYPEWFDAAIEKALHRFVHLVDRRRPSVRSAMP